MTPGMDSVGGNSGPSSVDNVSRSLSVDSGTEVAKAVLISLIKALDPAQTSPIKTREDREPAGGERQRRKSDPGLQSGTGNDSGNERPLVSPISVAGFQTPSRVERYSDEPKGVVRNLSSEFGANAANSRVVVGGGSEPDGVVQELRFGSGEGGGVEANSRLSSPMRTSEADVETLKALKASIQKELKDAFSPSSRAPSEVSDASHKPLENAAIAKAMTDVYDTHKKDLDVFVEAFGEVLAERAAENPEAFHTFFQTDYGGLLSMVGYRQSMGFRFENGFGHRLGKIKTESPNTALDVAAAQKEILHANIAGGNSCIQNMGGTLVTFGKEPIPQIKADLIRDIADILMSETNRGDLSDPNSGIATLRDAIVASPTLAAVIRELKSLSVITLLAKGFATQILSVTPLSESLSSDKDATIFYQAWKTADALDILATRPGVSVNRVYKTARYPPESFGDFSSISTRKDLDAALSSQSESFKTTVATRLAHLSSFSAEPAFGAFTSALDTATKIATETLQSKCTERLGALRKDFRADLPNASSSSSWFTDNASKSLPLKALATEVIAFSTRYDDLYRAGDTIPAEKQLSHDLETFAGLRMKHAANQLIKEFIIAISQGIDGGIGEAQKPESRFTALFSPLENGSVKHVYDKKLKELQDTLKEKELDLAKSEYKRVIHELYTAMGQNDDATRKAQYTDLTGKDVETQLALITADIPKIKALQLAYSAACRALLACETAEEVEGMKQNLLTSLNVGPKTHSAMARTILEGINIDPKINKLKISEELKIREAKAAAALDKKVRLAAEAARAAALAKAGVIAGIVTQKGVLVTTRNELDEFRSRRPGDAQDQAKETTPLATAFGELHDLGDTSAESEIAACKDLIFQYSVAMGAEMRELRVKELADLASIAILKQELAAVVAQYNGTIKTPHPPSVDVKRLSEELTAQREKPHARTMSDLAAAIKADMITMASSVSGHQAQLFAANGQFERATTELGKSLLAFYTAIGVADKSSEDARRKAAEAKETKDVPGDPRIDVKTECTNAATALLTGETAQIRALTEHYGTAQKAIETTVRAAWATPDLKPKLETVLAEFDSKASDMPGAERDAARQRLDATIALLTQSQERRVIARDKLETEYKNQGKTPRELTIIMPVELHSAEEAARSTLKSSPYTPSELIEQIVINLEKRLEGLIAFKNKRAAEAANQKEIRVAKEQIAQLLSAYSKQGPNSARKAKSVYAAAITQAKEKEQNVTEKNPTRAFLEIVIHNLGDAIIAAAQQTADAKFNEAFLQALPGRFFDSEIFCQLQQRYEVLIQDGAAALSKLIADLSAITKRDPSVQTEAFQKTITAKIKELEDHFVTNVSASLRSDIAGLVTQKNKTQIALKLRSDAALVPEQFMKTGLREEINRITDAHFALTLTEAEAIANTALTDAQTTAQTMIGTQPTTETAAQLTTRMTEFDRAAQAALTAFDNAVAGLPGNQAGDARLGLTLGITSTKSKTKAALQAAVSAPLQKIETAIAQLLELTATTLAQLTDQAQADTVIQLKSRREELGQHGSNWLTDGLAEKIDRTVAAYEEKVHQLQRREESATTIQRVVRRNRAALIVQFQAITTMAVRTDTLANRWIDIAAKETRLATLQTTSANIPRLEDPQVAETIQAVQTALGLHNAPTDLECAAFRVGMNMALTDPALTTAAAVLDSAVTAVSSGLPAGSATLARFTVAVTAVRAENANVNEGAITARITYRQHVADATAVLAQVRDRTATRDALEVSIRNIGAVPVNVVVGAVANIFETADADMAGQLKTVSDGLATHTTLVTDFGLAITTATGQLQDMGANPTAAAKWTALNLANTTYDAAVDEGGYLFDGDIFGVGVHPDIAVSNTVFNTAWNACKTNVAPEAAAIRHAAAASLAAFVAPGSTDPQPVFATLRDGVLDGLRIHVDFRSSVKTALAGLGIHADIQAEIQIRLALHDALQDLEADTTSLPGAKKIAIDAAKELFQSRPANPAYAACDAILADRLNALQIKVYGAVAEEAAQNILLSAPLSRVAEAKISGNTASLIQMGNMWQSLENKFRDPQTGPGWKYKASLDDAFTGILDPSTPPKDTDEYVSFLRTAIERLNSQSGTSGLPAPYKDIAETALGRLEHRNDGPPQLCAWAMSANLRLVMSVIETFGDTRAAQVSGRGGVGDNNIALHKGITLKQIDENSLTGYSREHGDLWSTLHSGNVEFLQIADLDENNFPGSRLSAYDIAALIEKMATGSILKIEDYVSAAGGQEATLTQEGWKSFCTNLGADAAISAFLEAKWPVSDAPILLSELHRRLEELLKNEAEYKHLRYLFGRKLERVYQDLVIENVSNT